MLEEIFKSSRANVRLRRGPIGAQIDDFAASLLGRGLAARTIQDYVRAAAHFSHWMDGRQISVGQLSDRYVDEFLEDRQRERSNQGINRHDGAALRALLSTLRSQGIVRAEPLAARPAWAPFVDQYADYLSEVRGVVPATRRIYSSCASALLTAKFGIASAELSRLSVADLASHVLRRGQSCSMNEARQTATALRSFTRYLHVAGLCGPELALGIPSPSVRGPSTVPTVLDDNQVSALLAVFDRASAIGRRGYAMAMCLVGLGLRACEVSDLSLDDIDWRESTICIVRSKERRASTLPLPMEVGEALVGYLSGGRPTTRSRRVFVRHAVPKGEPLTSSAVRMVIRRAFERAGVDVPCKGTHVLRRTAATKMIRGGASVKEVADVLRHRSINTMVLYARIDLHALAEVVMPWPEVCS